MKNRTLIAAMLTAGINATDTTEYVNWPKDAIQEADNLIKACGDDPDEEVTVRVKLSEILECVNFKTCIHKD